MKTASRIALCTGVLLASALCLCRCAVGAGVSFDTDGTLLVDGDRFFPVGIYELPEGDALDEIAGAGFNIVKASPSIESLDRAASAGLKAWIPLGGSMDVRDGAARDKLVGIIERCKNHPALLVWEGPDEPLWNVWYSTQGWMYGGQVEAFADRIKAAGEGNAAPGADKFFEYQAALNVADYASAEAAAAKLWDALGEPPPRPDMLMSTAPQRAKALADGLHAGYAAIRETDPAHPVWLNHAPRNTVPDLAYFNRAADIVGCDIYPVPVDRTNGHSDLENKRLSCVGDYTERMQAAGPGKAVWMVLQGFGWRDLRDEKPEDKTEGRRPRYDETRFMAYDAIVHGADAILYWGTHYIDKPSRFWTVLKRVVTELNGLGDVLAARTLDIDLHVELNPTLHSADRGIVAIAKRARGKAFVIAVNECHQPLGCRISGIPVADKASLRDTQTGSMLTVEDGTVDCFLGGYGVAVLEEQQ